MTLMSWGGSEKNQWFQLNQWFFSEPPQLIRDSHYMYMVLPQTFPYASLQYYIYSVTTVNSQPSYYVAIQYYLCGFER